MLSVTVCNTSSTISTSCSFMIHSQFRTLHLIYIVVTAQAKAGPESLSSTKVLASLLAQCQPVSHTPAGWTRKRDEKKDWLTETIAVFFCLHSISTMKWTTCRHKVDVTLALLQSCMLLRAYSCHSYVTSECNQLYEIAQVSCRCSVPMPGLHCI